MKKILFFIIYSTIIGCTSPKLKERSFNLYECGYYLNFKIVIIGFTDVDYDIYAYNNIAEYTGVVYKNIINEKASRRKCSEEDSTSLLNFTRQKMN